MRSKIQHIICYLFLWTIIVPQASNLLHFVVIPHDFGQSIENELRWVEKGKVHYCDQYLFKQTFALLAEVWGFEPIVSREYKKENYRISIDMFFSNFYCFQRRGPPSL